jgi:hypothetical protein
LNHKTCLTIKFCRCLKCDSISDCQ